MIVETARRWVMAIAVFAALFAANPKCHAQATSQSAPETAPRHSTQRLYLRDGSYQTVTEYHLAGDHVHYYSAERAAWEDVPMDLVDLAATQKWNAERDKIADQQRAARAAERAAEDAEVRQKLDAARPEVADKLRLPEKGYFWGLDVFHGRPELLPMVQPAAEAAARDKARSETAGQDKKTRKNPSQIAANEATARAYIANAALQPPLPPESRKAGSREELHLDGTDSRREFHVTGPVFYLRVGNIPDPHFVLERMEQDFKHQERRMAPPSVDALGGGSGKGFAVVKVEAMPGSQWLKVTIPTELPIGEYALVRILGPTQWDEHVWDFGVNPRGFENGEVVSAETGP